MSAQESSLTRALAMVRARELTQLQTDEDQGDREADPLSDAWYSSELQNHSTGITRTHEEMAGDDNDEFPLDPSRTTTTQIFPLEKGRALKRHKKFSPEAEADSERFLHTVNPIEHAYMSYLVLLEIRDAMKGILADNAKKYQIPETLKKTIQDYAHVAILSPSVQCYRGSTLIEAVLNAMRELNIADVPPSRETGRCELAQTVISKALTDWRHHVKCVITKSLNEAENKQDIATLTVACIGSSKAKPTAALYIRIAFLRSHLRTFLSNGKENLKGEAFWKSVDTELSTWRKSFPLPSQLQYAFKSVYDEDIKLYGEPDGIHQLTAVKDLDSWLTTINTHSGHSVVLATPPTPARN